AGVLVVNRLRWQEALMLIGVVDECHAHLLELLPGSLDGLLLNDVEDGADCPECSGQSKPQSYETHEKMSQAQLSFRRVSRWSLPLTRLVRTEVGPCVVEQVRHGRFSFAKSLSDNDL